MSATRTQVYLTRQQRARLDELARRRGGSMAELVREAVDAYLDEVAPDADEALGATFGLAHDFEAPTRAEWEARERRLRRG